LGILTSTTRFQWVLLRTWWNLKKLPDIGIFECLWLERSWTKPQILRPGLVRPMGVAARPGTSTFRPGPAQEHNLENPARPMGRWGVRISRTGRGWPARPRTAHGPMGRAAWAGPSNFGPESSFITFCIVPRVLVFPLFVWRIHNSYFIFYILCPVSSYFLFCFGPENSFVLQFCFPYIN